MWQAWRHWFAPDDIAEAFAASRSITLPSQLRNRLRADRPDAIITFRRLAPERSEIAIQLWSMRRVAVTVSVLIGGVILISVLVAYFRMAGLL